MLDNYRDLIDELLATPATVRRLAEEHGGHLPPSALRLVVELRDRDRAVIGRLQTMIRQTAPYLRMLRVPEPTELPAAAAVLEQFDTARGDLVSMLMNLTLRDWERTAIDEVGGEIALADEVERHVEFDEDHLAQIEQAAAAQDSRSG